LRTWKKIGIGVLALVAAGGGYVAWQIGPRNIVGMLRYDKRRDGDWKVGDRAPNVALAELEGDGRQDLLGRLKGRPLVLVFGSFT
jgi:hypothetical protein